LKNSNPEDVALMGVVEMKNEDNFANLFYS
jgi:hypothetical protein